MVLERQNKFLDPYFTSQSRLELAKKLLAENGSLTEAALLLEAAIQHGELGAGGYEAWILLGETRSMDEREDTALPALVEGTAKANEAASLEGLMVSVASCFNPD
jgi:peroxin-5